MTYVVTEACSKCIYMVCVEVCPVDCFYEGKSMLVLYPEQCIDYGVCLTECPVDAILQDSEGGLAKWLELNTQHARVWPNITSKGEVPPDVIRWLGAIHRFELFNPLTGKGI